MILRLLGVWVLAVSLGGCAAAPEEDSSEPQTSSAETGGGAAGAAVVSEATYLERRLELATSDVFYLLLDQDTRQLELMFGGALLQSYSVGSLSLGRPRTLLASAADAVEWQATTFHAGVLSPPHPRVDLRPVAYDEGEVATDPLAFVPPTAQEAIPAPPRYRIRFEGGLALEVRTSPEEGGWWARQRAAWVLRWQDVGSALIPSDRDNVRLLITLDAESAASLYRALPPDAKLLVSFRQLLTDH